MTGDCHAGILWEPGGEIPPGDPTPEPRIATDPLVATCGFRAVVRAVVVETADAE